MDLILTHDYNDNNIFHIFLLDIVRYYHSYYRSVKIYTYDDKLDKNNLSQKWRYFFLKKLFQNVEYIDNIPHGFFGSHIIVYPYDCMNTIKYPMNPRYMDIYSKVSSNCKGEYILLNQRYDDNRTLYDDDTGLLIEECIQNLEIPIKICDFGKMTPEEQYEICSKAKLFISMHGAGCTNMLFTPLKHHSLK